MASGEGDGARLPRAEGLEQRVDVRGWGQRCRWGKGRLSKCRLVAFTRVTRTRGGQGDVGPVRGDPLATPV